MKNLSIVRVYVEEIRDKFPNLYRELKKKGVIATVTIYGKSAHCQVYEFKKGNLLVYGSYYLYKKWQKGGAK